MAGWQRQSVGHLGQVVEFRLPPFEEGMDRHVRRTVAGRIGPGWPFQAFTYVVDGAPTEVVTLPLPCPLPPLVVHRGQTRRAGLLTPVSVPGADDPLGAGGDFEIECDHPGLAQAALGAPAVRLLRDWGSRTGYQGDGLLPTFDIAFDGPHLVALDGPEPDDPRFLAYLSRLANLASLLTDAPIRHFARRPPLPRLGFRDQPWAWAGSQPQLAFRYRWFAGMGSHSAVGPAEGIVRGTVAGRPFTAFTCATPERFSVVVAHVPANLPALWIDRTPTSTPGPEFGPGRWRVRSTDLRFAHDLLPPTTLDWLGDAAGVPGLRARGHEIGIAIDRYAEDELAAALDTLGRVLTGAAPPLRRALRVNPALDRG